MPARTNGPQTAGPSGMAGRGSAALMSRVTHLAGQLLQADAWALWRRDAQTDEWESVADSGLSAQFPRRAQTTGKPLPGAAVWVPDVDDDPLLGLQNGALDAEGVRSILYAPLGLPQELTACITFFYRQPHEMRAEDLRSAEAL